MSNKTSSTSKDVKEVEVIVNELYGVKREELAGFDKNQAIKFLIVEKDLENDVATKVWSAFGTKNKGGVFGAFLKFIEIEPRTANDLAEFLLSDKSSSNEVRWFNQRDSIRKTVNTVFVNLGQKFTEVAVTPENIAKMEKAVKAVDDANKAKKLAAAKKA